MIAVAKEMMGTITPKLVSFTNASQTTGGGGGYYWRTYIFNFVFQSSVDVSIAVQVYDSWNYWETTYYNTGTGTWDSSQKSYLASQAGTTLSGACSTYRYYPNSPPLVATQARCLMYISGVLVDSITFNL